MQAESVMGSQRFCLRWNNHQTNLLSVFDQLLHDEAFVDVTLAVEGQFLRAHKMVLSACSPYFQALFVGHPDKHPIVILKDVPYSDMRSLLDFMYRGEVSVDQDRLTAFLKVAESLRIKGLTEVNEERCDLPSIANSLLNQTFTPPPPPPPPSLHRLPMPTVPPGQSKPIRPPPNPMLNSALTAPKRKRGRPRKLSGSSPNPPPISQTDLEHDEQKPPISTTPLENHLGVPFPSVGVPQNPHVQHSSQPPQGNPIPLGQELPVSPFRSCLPSTVPSPGIPPPTSAPPPSNPPSSSIEEPESPKMEEEDDEDCEDLSKMEDGEDDGGLEEDPPDPSNHVLKSEDPKPSTSGQDSLASFQSSTQSDGDRFSSGQKIQSAESGFAEVDEDSLQSAMTGNYEDLIACSPASSEDNEIYASQSIEPEFADEEMSQFEEDSLRSLMGRSVSENDGSRRRMDKMSIRKFCLREGDQVHRCTICSKAYTHISNFCRHFLSAHCGTKQEIHCPVCHKPFTRKDNMMTHAKQVHGYSCMRGILTDQLPTYDQQPAD